MRAACSMPRLTTTEAGLLRVFAVGYSAEWSLLVASDFGVSQLRPRSLLVALRDGAEFFTWPAPQSATPPSVGEMLLPLMASRGWLDAEAWSRRLAPLRRPLWEAR